MWGQGAVSLLTKEMLFLSRTGSPSVPQYFLPTKSLC